MRYAFIGLGFAARSLHVPAIRSLPGARIVGGFDVVEERRRAWTDLGHSPSFESVEALLESATPDVVVVGTPPSSHAGYCIEALAADAHVLCEKPFVETLDQADAVLAAAESAGRRVAVNHEFRYMPIFSCLPGAIDRADVGRPVTLQCLQLMDLAPWDEPVPWRAAMPDRSLFEGGVHLVDLLHMIVGRVPRWVSGVVSSGLEPGRSADAVHLVTLDYGDGLLGQITIDRLCKAGTRYVDLRINCEHASLRASFGGRALVRLGAKRAERTGVRVEFGPEGLAWLERGLQRKVLARNRRGATVRATRALHEACSTAWLDDRDPPTAAHEARQTLRIIEASYRSARTGERVALGPG